MHGRPRRTHAEAGAETGEIERYLADPAYRFTLPLAPPGTPFRRR